jgi:hypothetical protein
MNQDEAKATTHSVAMIAMYLMNGYEAEARALNGSELQDLSGHLAVADEIARISAAIHEMLETEALPVGGQYPGVLEYEVIEPLGKWLHAHSMCTIEEGVAEFARRFEAWMKNEPAEADLNVLELARNAVEARAGYKAALREFEVATTGGEGGWPSFRRNRVEEFIDAIGDLVDHQPTSPLQALIAVANGKS